MTTQPQTFQLYDHTGMTPQKSILAAATKVGLHATLASAVDKISADIAFVHTGSDTDWDLVVKNAKSGNVRVRISTQGRMTTATPVVNSAGVYCFELTVPATSKSMPSGDWEKIIGGCLSHQVLSDFSGGKTSSNLRQYFFREVLEVLPSLAILCQGYLAVCAEFKGKKTWCDEDIQPALEQMGWTKFIQDKGSEIIKQGFGCPEDWKGVTNPDWWLGVFCDKQDDHVLTDGEKKQLLEKLYQGVKAERKNASPEIDKLIGLLGTQAVDAPKIVSDAYCELVKELGGAPCPKA